MAVAVDGAGPLIDMLARRMKPLRDALLLVGICYSTKLVLKGTFALLKGFKTFGLPMVWPRNFPKEYGEWAGKYIMRPCTK